MFLALFLFIWVKILSVVPLGVAGWLQCMLESLTRVDYKASLVILISGGTI